jgi:toxin ParE1/3/4
MRLRWTLEAAHNLESIYLYLRESYPSLAGETIQTLYDATGSLRSFPYRGRLGTIDGTREFVLPRLPFLIVYRINDQSIEVLHIYHGAQDR